MSDISWMGSMLFNLTVLAHSHGRDDLADDIISLMMRYGLGPSAGGIENGNVIPFRA